MKSVTFRCNGELLGIFYRPRRLIDGRWSEGSAPTPRLRQLTREALKMGWSEVVFEPCTVPPELVKGLGGVEEV